MTYLQRLLLLINQDLSDAEESGDRIFLSQLTLDFIEYLTKENPICLSEKKSLEKNQTAHSKEE